MPQPRQVGARARAALLVSCSCFPAQSCQTAGGSEAQYLVLKLGRAMETSGSLRKELSRGEFGQGPAFGLRGLLGTACALQRKWGVALRAVFHRLPCGK